MAAIVIPPVSLLIPISPPWGAPASSCSSSESSVSAWALRTFSGSFKSPARAPRAMQQMTLIRFGYTQDPSPGIAQPAQLENGTRCTH